MTDAANQIPDRIPINLIVNGVSRTLTPTLGRRVV
jgi:hypothetical protein